VVDDHALFRMGIANILGREPDFEIVAEAEDSRGAIDRALETSPDIILMDLSLPSPGGIETTQRIKRELPSTGIIVLAQTEDEDALFDAIGRRHTDRAAYDAARPVPSDALEAMWETFKEDPEVRLFLYSATEERRQFGAAVVAATERVVGDPRMIADSQRWFRHRWADVERLRDGPTLDAAGLPAWMTAAAKLLPPPSPETNHRYWLDATRDVHVPATALNPRIVEATACGALVVSEWRPDLDTVAPSIPTFQSVEQCIALVEAFLADPGARAARVMAGQAELVGHTYAARLETVLAAVAAPVGVA